LGLQDEELTAMARQVEVDEARASLPDLIDAAIGGEDVVIQKNEKQAVQLVPVEAAQRNPQFGSAKGLVVVADDFDAPLEDFREYMS
jgi:antitoxin (DNA-binding transcriptional repressor) of toxin-antitoxin stability system